MVDFGAIINKIKDNIFLIPEDKFDRLVVDRGYMDSWVYLAVCLVIGTLIALPISLVFSLLNTNPGAGLVVALIAGVVAIPLVVIISPLFYIGYGIEHLLLKLVGGKGTFLQTVQVFIYGSTPSLIFRGIPLVSMIMNLVALWNTILGAKRVHQLSLLKTIIAVVIIPAVIMLVLVGIIILLFGAMIFGLVSGAAALPTK